MNLKKQNVLPENAWPKLNFEPHEHWVVTPKPNTRWRTSKKHTYSNPNMFGPSLNGGLSLVINSYSTANSFVFSLTWKWGKNIIQLPKNYLTPFWRRKLFFNFLTRIKKKQDVKDWRDFSLGPWVISDKYKQLDIS